MRLTCPNCLTEYDVPDDAVAGRSRSLRCAYCGHQWRHGAGGAEAAGGTETRLEPAAEASGDTAGTAPAPAHVSAGPPIDDSAEDPNAPLIDVPPLLPEAPTHAPKVAQPPAAPAASIPPRQAPRDLQAAPRPFVPPPRAPQRRSRSPAVIALLIIAAIIIVLAAHRPIMRAWPASAGFYHALGIH